MKHPSVKKLARLSVFVIGYVIVNQIGYLIIQVLAAGQQGGYAAYVNAFTFFMLPHGLFAVSVITALLPGMSAHAVNAEWDKFRERLSTGMRATILLALPAAIGYLILGQPIIRLLLEHGNATAESTELVTSVLRVFVLGLVPFSLFQLFLRAFYALQDTKTPFLINCGAVALNTAINIPMFAWFGVQGLAAGMAIAYSFGSFVQGRALSRRIDGIDGAHIVRSAVKIGFASLLMGAGVWGVSQITNEITSATSLIGQILQVGVPVTAGVALYLGLATLFKVEELEMVRGIVGRRFKR
jgi:putative peptidoglycan lipid II flippase